MDRRVGSDFFEKSMRSFYEDLEKKSPAKIGLYIVLSLGFYAIQYVYDLNRKFEKLDDEAPESKRGLFVLLFLPSAWGYLTFLHEYLFEAPFFTSDIILGIVWSILIFFIITYLYDFCTIFAKFTGSDEKFWYYSLFPTFLGFTLIAIGYYYWGIFFLVISLSVLPTMQRELNKRDEEYHNYKNRYDFNSKGKVGSN